MRGTQRTTSSPVLVPSQHQKSTTETYNSNFPNKKVHKPSIMNIISRYSNNMPLRTRLQTRTFSNSPIVVSPRTPSIDSPIHQHSLSTGDVQAESLETALTTLSTSSSPELPKCLTIQGRYAGKIVPPVPTNSAVSSIADEVTSRQAQLPRSRSFHARRKGKMIARPVLHRQLSKFTRIEQEITYYHEVGAKHDPELVHAIIQYHSHTFDLQPWTPEQRIHFMGYIWRKEWDLEASMIPADVQSQYTYPKFWPEREMVDEYEWRYIDHEGNIRPQAYVAYSEETGELGPFSQMQLEKWRMEEFAQAKWRMGDYHWGAIHEWVMGVEDRWHECAGEVVARKEVKRQDSGTQS
jgi:hypothetical protein